MNIFFWNIRGAFREGIVYADRLTDMGHAIQGAVWLSTLPFELRSDFFRDRCGLPNYRFPESVVVFIFICYFLLMRVLA